MNERALVGAIPDSQTRGEGYHRKQMRSHQLVSAALARGTLQRKPCEVCGAVKVQAHHDDYDKPLEVRWLCSLDHHRAHPQGGRASRFGHMSVRQLREGLPIEAVYITQRDRGFMETVALWIPIELVDE